MKFYEKEYDVVVCGAGIAGVVAALASSRRGLKTALLEKTILPGGLATSGLVQVFLPLCDGQGKQLIFGITEELLCSANHYGPYTLNPHWSEDGARYKVNFSPASFVLEIDRLLQKSNVDLWLDTIIINSIAEGRLLKKIEVFNKSGRGYLSAKNFVDATGDADVAWLSGNQCLFAANAMVLWTLEHNEHQHSAAHGYGTDCQMSIHADPLSNLYTSEQLSGKMVTDFVLEGRRRYRELLDAEYAAEKSSNKTHYPMTLQTQPPIRKGRCIQGRLRSSENTGSDIVGIFADWRKPGRIHTISQSALLPDNLDNLIAAGRCIYAKDDDTWEAQRVIPVAGLTGEIAGVSAALAAANNIAVADLPVDTLKSELEVN